MTALKILVGVMTVLLVAGFGMVVGGMVMQAKRLDTGFGATDVTLPPGAKVVETTINGDRVVLRVALSDGEERLYVMDVGSGRAVGTISIKRAP